MTDYDNKVDEKYQAILKEREDERIKEEKKLRFLAYFKSRVEKRKDEEKLKELHIDDYDYQMDVDTELSDVRVELINKE